MADVKTVPEPVTDQNRTLRGRWQSLVGAWRSAARRARHKPLQSLVLGAGLLAVAAGAAAAWIHIQGLRERDEPFTLIGALSALDAGDLDEARRVAAELRYGDQLPYEQLGGPVYVLGVAMIRDAERQLDSAERRNMWLIAARYLEEARDRGFPAGREADGLFYLGQSLHRGGRHAESLPVLLQAAAMNSGRRAELDRLLAEAYLRDVPPQPEQALVHIGRYLQDPQLTASRREEGLVEQSRILLESGDLSAARRVLEAVPKDSRSYSEAVLMAGRLLMRQAELALADTSGGDVARRQAAAAEMYAAALDQLRTAMTHDITAVQSTPKSAYLIGVCFRGLGDLQQAQDQFRETRQMHASSPEATAASLELAELQQMLGDDASALETYRRLLRDVGDAATYANDWVPLPQLRRRIRAAYERWLAPDRYERAIDLTKIMWPLFPRSDCVQWRCEAQRAMGEQLLQQADAAPPQQAGAWGAQGRAAYRRAAAGGEQLARLWATRREYPDVLWQSAQDYFQGRSYRNALRMLDAYLENESRRRRPESLVMKGEALLALGEFDAAWDAVSECIHFHAKHPSSYRARLIASQVALNRGEAGNAKKLLSDNLYMQELTPLSVEWRDSLFALGQAWRHEGLALAIQARRQLAASVDAQARREVERLAESSQGAHGEAARTLHEYVRRYADSPHAPEGRYWIAESHRRVADLARMRRDMAAIETTKMALTQQLRKEMETALAAYEDLLARFNERQDTVALSEVEQRIVRNCYFARADANFELERYEDAIAAYSSATNRYHDRPESLEAYLQISRCYRELGLSVEARGTLELAKVMLRRMPADADFSLATRYPRDEWTRLLDWLSTL